MKSLLLAITFVLCFDAAHAADTFPGLKSVLTEAEWKRAGLDRLTPDELGVIDAALIRHHAAALAPLQTELTAARETSAAPAEPKRRLLERFGLSSIGEDWRSQPALQARVLKWESANRFQLDNGQTWEGMEPITYELVGKPIEIQARPHGHFALVVEGVNTTLRVRRVR